MGEPYAISSLHGMNTGDLLDDLVKIFPDQVEDEDENRIKLRLLVNRMLENPVC